MRSVVAAEAVEGAQMAQCVALAPYPLVQFGEVAMGFDCERVTFDRPIETLQRILVFLAPAIEESDFQMHFGLRGNDRRSAEQMAQRVREIALLFEQRRHPHVNLEVARLAAQKIAVKRERPQRVAFGQPLSFLETLAHSRRSETVFDLPRRRGAVEA